MQKNILVLFVIGILVVFGVVYAVTFNGESEREPAEEENLTVEEEKEKEEIAEEEAEERDETKEDPGKEVIEEKETKIQQEETTEDEEKEGRSFIECLADSGVVIYGSEWCPACSRLVEEFGGYEIVEPIYVECTIEEEKCAREMQDIYVPEIQIQGELFDDLRSPESLAEETGCKL